MAPRAVRLVATLFFVLTFSLASAFAPYGIEPFHDGNVFKPAKDVAEGQVLYRDTWSQYGPLTTGLMAAAITVFGAKLIVVRFLAAFFYGLTATMLVLIGSRVAPLWVVVVSVLAWLVGAGYLDGMFMPWSSVYALFFSLAALYLVLRACDHAPRRARHLIALAGVMAGLANLARSPTGLLELTAFLGLFAACGFGPRGYDPRAVAKRSACLLMGFTAPLIGFVLWLLAKGALNDWWIQNFRFMFVFGGAFSHVSSPRWILVRLFPFTSEWRCGLPWESACGETPGSYLYGLLPTITLVELALLARRWLNSKTLLARDRDTLGLVLMALTSWHQYIPFPDSGYHAYWAATPMYLVAGATVFGAGSVVASRMQWRGASVAVLVTAFFLVLVGKEALPACRYAWSDKLWSDKLVTMTTPEVLAGLKVDPGQASSLEHLDGTVRKYLERHPMATVISVHKDSLYLTLFSRGRNFHPLYMDWSPIHDFFPDAFYPGYWAALNTYVRREQPLIIGRVGLAFPGYTVLDNIPTVSAWPPMNIVLLIPPEQPLYPGTPPRRVPDTARRGTR